MTRFRTRFGAIALPCLLLVACATTSGTATPTPVDRAAAALDRAEASYERLKLLADVLAPLLPPAYQTRLHDAEDIAAQAFASARAALTLADKLAELRKAEAALHDIATITGQGE